MLMTYDDEDDIEGPLSSRRALERADHGKKEKAEVKQKENNAKELFKLQRDVLQTNIQGQKDDQTKKQSESFGTKTHKQEEESEKDGADRKVNPDSLLKEDAVQEAAEDAAAYEEDQAQAG
ncbi:MAG: hypothetical protein JWM56_338 [Candidatus Peribacteria bacterium]|nr:hypothetical protein [Candidatus Peribacteria bacterium]